MYIIIKASKVPVLKYVNYKVLEKSILIFKVYTILCFDTVSKFDIFGSTKHYIVNRKVSSQGYIHLVRKVQLLFFLVMLLAKAVKKVGSTRKLTFFPQNSIIGVGMGVLKCVYWLHPLIALEFPI